MHNFSELIKLCGNFTINNLNELENKICKELEVNASTVLVKQLQMINLQKFIFIIGVFSIFESILQQELNCENGLKEAKHILKQKEEFELLERLSKLQLVINALKHGKGRSYNHLIENLDERLINKIKYPNQSFLNEGNINEITALVSIDNKFICENLDLIEEVYSLIGDN